MVLLIIAVLSAMVGEFLFGVRLHAELLSNHRNGVKSRYIGRSAFNAYRYLAEANLLSPGNPQNLLVLSKWVGFGSGLENVEEGDMAAALLGIGASPLDPDPEGPLRGQWSVPLPSDIFDLDGIMYGRLVNERGKLNLNAIINSNTRDRTGDTVNRKVYNRLFTLFQILKIEDEDALTCLDGVVDWVDGNFSNEPRGAEEDHYRSLDDHPYYPRNNYLLSVDEMRLVNGCTADIVERVKEFVTVYPRKGPRGDGIPDYRIDAAAAPKAVLMAVFLAPPAESDISPNDHDVADAICEEIYTRAMERCGITVTVSESSGPRIRSPSLLKSGEITEIIAGRLSGNFDFYNFHLMDAQYYQIRAVGEVNNVIAGIEAVIKKSVKGVEVVYWKED